MMTEALLKDYQTHLIEIAKQAGQAIMHVYSTDFTVERKDDNSPLTQADLAAHHTIVEALAKLTPTIPVLSEESETIPFDVRKEWQQYWLIDPLDGTREFVKRNGEFTVNIALIEQQLPVLGVVYAPVTEVMYFAARGLGAYKQVKSGAIERINTKKLELQKPVIAGSRSNSDAKMQTFMENLANSLGVTPELISMGSSLKICLVAEGAADVYPRLGPTSEWDTAAAHIVLNEAGGDIVDADGRTLRYNTKASLLNPYFFAENGAKHTWSSYC